MRFIADSDKERIEKARNLLTSESSGPALDAFWLLGDVLDNMRDLEQERDNPAPIVVELTEAELRAIYPERFN